MSLLMAYGVIVSGLCNMNRLDSAVEVKKVMMGYGVAPDGVIFATLMHAYFKAGNVEAAMNESGT